MSVLLRKSSSLTYSLLRVHQTRKTGDREMTINQNKMIAIKTELRNAEQATLAVGGSVEALQETEWYRDRVAQIEAIYAE